jgi:carboxymethylenebutenolidase
MLRGGMTEVKIPTPRVMMAPRNGVSAASVNYGGATDALERALPAVCPIVGSYGAKDRWPGMRRVPDRLESMLTAAGVEHDIKVYPDAGHGFLNDHEPAELPVWVKAIAKLAAAGYHEPSARDARRRILDFFDLYLKS